jgi:hypothetical protein
MSGKVKRFIARALLVLILAIPPTVGIIAETTHSAPPRATLAIRRGTLVYAQRMRRYRGHDWISLLVADGKQEFSAAVVFPKLFAQVADLVPKTRITLYTADSYWFDRVTPAPDIWQIDTDAGTVLSYAQSLTAWQARRKRAIDVFSLLAAIPLLVCCCLDWFELRSGRQDN